MKIVDFFFDEVYLYSRKIINTQDIFPRAEAIALLALGEHKKSYMKTKRHFTARITKTNNVLVCRYKVKRKKKKEDIEEEIWVGITNEKCLTFPSTI